MAAQGLTGVAYLEADYLNPERNPPLRIDWRPDHPYIPSARSRITQLSDAVERILRNIEEINVPQITASIERSLTAMTKLADSANLDKIGVQASALLNELRTTNRQIGTLVSDPQLKTAIADASATAGHARQIIERAEKPVNQLLADLPQTTDSLNRLVKRLDSVASDLPQTSAELRQTIQRMNRLIAGQQRDIEQTMIGIEPDDSPVLDSCNGGAMRRAKRTVAAHETFRLPRFSYVVHAHVQGRWIQTAVLNLSLSFPTTGKSNLV